MESYSVHYRTRGKQNSRHVDLPSPRTFTARDMFGTLAPVALDRMLSLQPGPNDAPPVLNILDLTNVPYVDSAGLGRIVRHYVHCRGKGVRLIVAGASPRVLEVFKMTKVDSIIPLSATVEEAEIG